MVRRTHPTKTSFRSYTIIYFQYPDYIAKVMFQRLFDCWSVIFRNASSLPVKERTIEKQIRIFLMTLL